MSSERDDGAGPVKHIFRSITHRYDLLNHILSLGRDVAWRKAAVGRMRFFQTNRLVDVATGTADLAIAAARHYPLITVAGVDFAPEMMQRGERKIRAYQLERRIRLLKGDALTLPFHAESFDVAAMAFGIRNISDRIAALRELRRVVVPGGQVMILEMTLPRKAWLRSGYRFYLHSVLPRVAGSLSGNFKAYEYLAISIETFPDPSAFAFMMEQSGLTDVQCVSLTGGITVLHIGTKEEGPARYVSGA